MSTHAVDVFGLSNKDAQQIMKTYGKNLSEIESAFRKKSIHFYSNHGPREFHDGIIEKKQALIKRIKKENDFLFVDLQTIFYPDDNAFYTTIEIIDNAHPERLRFVNTTTIGESTIIKSSHPPDLIDSMIEYTHTGIELMVNHKIDYATFRCPAYHCTAGFQHPMLQPYLKIFDLGAIKQRGFILKTLAHDPDPQRRAAAAFLVAHFHDPHDIITVLTPHVVDHSEDVRNNVMRVIGETMTRGEVSHINVMPFLNALDSPYISDRNKALLVLVKASDDKTSREIILQKGGEKLIALLQLKQPNNHDLAYLILKKTSKEDFGSTNWVAWKDWISSQKSPSPSLGLRHWESKKYQVTLDKALVA
jgi:hypothetical protein